MRPHHDVDPLLWVPECVANHQLQRVAYQRRKAAIEAARETEIPHAHTRLDWQKGRR